jgi:hypothetical protein
LASTSLSDFYEMHPFERKHEKQQLLSVYEFMQSKLAEDIGVCFKKNRYQLPTTGIENTFNITCAPPTSFGPSEDHFQQDEGYLEKPPTSITFQLLKSGNPKYSPLPNMTFDPYRKFGFAIFDDRRMTDLGFSEPDGRSLFGAKRFQYNWFSILTEEERNLSIRKPKRIIGLPTNELMGANQT